MMLKFKKFISKEIVNGDRQVELDIARGLAVLFMVLIHVQMSFSTPNLEDTLFEGFIDFLGGIPAAPVFMFLMGVGFLYTRKAGSRHFLKRGIQILMLGYTLNFLRDSLPEMFDYFTEGNEESLNSAIEGFIDVDIFQFAGLTMICFGLIKRLQIAPIYVGLIALVFSFMGYLLSGVQVEDYWSSAITGLFWGSNEFSEFPFFNWAFYPLIGYCFAYFLVRCNNKKRFYLIIFVASSINLVLCTYLFAYVWNIELGFEEELNYYHHNFFANIIYSLFVFSWISLIFMLLRFIPEYWVRILKRWSKNVTEIYFVHWVIIGWLSWFLYECSLGVVHYLLLSVTIFIISDNLATVMQKRNLRLV